MITADRIYYVRPDGNDANTGLANTAADAFRTIQCAVDAALSIDWGRFTVKIVAQSGTAGSPTVYTDSISVIGTAPGQRTALVIQSSDATFSNACISVSGKDAIAVSFGAWVRVTGFTISAPSTLPVTASCINVTAGGRCDFGNIAFGSATYMHVNVAGTGSTAAAVANFAISGGAQGFVHVTNGAQVSLNNVTAYLSGTVPFSAYFAGLAACGILQAYNFVASGAATGPRFTVHKNSIIDTSGQSPLTYFPGSSAGVEATGGRWV
ncbi:MAG: hypothetical protein OJJ21_16590 [Ferrovibrio sp.]|uniref:hypothetical protein n=1 Tax=Ferrovibrio sp. TaxID=1917215 RepID=UPI00262F4EB0|nr:hypothetical protein [Ferrovibrio sp.]MCW0235221.1 hypothetical protein [Ferrovibrio sp.]